MSYQAEDILEKLSADKTRVENAIAQWTKLKDFEFDLCAPAIYLDRGDQYATLYIFGLDKYNAGALHEAREACKTVFPGWTDMITEMHGYGGKASVIWSCERHPEFEIRFTCDLEECPQSLMKKGCEWVEEKPDITPRFVLSCSVPS